MTFRSLAFFLAAAPLALSAQSWQPTASLIWSQPQGGLKDLGTDRALGLSLGAQVQQGPDGALRAFGEYRRVWSGNPRYSLADLGFDLTNRIDGALYGFAGLSAERIHLPRRDAAIKLGVRGGLGWAFSQRFGLETTYTIASLDHRSVNTVDVSLVLAF